MFRLTVTLPSALSVTFDTGITPIPPSNLRELSSFARSDVPSPTDNTHAHTNLLLVIATSSFHNAGSHCSTIRGRAGFLQRYVARLSADRRSIGITSVLRE